MKTFYSKLAPVMIIGMLLFSSCKKEEISFAKYESTNVDRLTGDTSILVGTWVWVYTDHYYGWCDNESYYEYLDSATENIKFEIKFTESGYVSYFRNDTLTSIYRVSFDYFDINSELACGPSTKQFSIDLDGFDDLPISGCVSDDTLKCHAAGFIFYSKVGCENYVNFFVKE